MFNLHGFMMSVTRQAQDGWMVGERLVRGKYFLRSSKGTIMVFEFQGNVCISENYKVISQICEAYLISS